MNLKNGKVFTSKFLGTGPSSYKQIIYRAAVSQSLRNTGLEPISHRLIASNRVVHLCKVQFFVEPPVKSNKSEEITQNTFVS
jgi:hypothetical protein